MEKNPDQFKNLPTLPGVYQFKNKDDKILYIGKAKNLKNRNGVPSENVSSLPKKKFGGRMTKIAIYVLF